MLLLISDANILIDMDTGGLLALGLQSVTLQDHLVAEVVKLSQRHRRPGRNDLFALALAASEECPLLTGDKDLRVAAEAEQVEVRGTLWLVTEMARTKKISTQVARAAYQRMRDSGRRLPWDEAERMLAGLDAEQS